MGLIFMKFFEDVFLIVEVGSVTYRYALTLICGYFQENLKKKILYLRYIN